MPSALVIDDDSSLVELMQAILRRSGYDTHGTVSSEEGLQLITLHHPDVIFINDTMPRMSGVEVCARVKNDPALRHIPVVIVSAGQNARDPNYAVQTGADAVLLKPYLPNDVAKTLKKLM